MEKTFRNSHVERILIQNKCIYFGSIKKSNYERVTESHFISNIGDFYPF